MNCEYESLVRDLLNFNPYRTFTITFYFYNQETIENRGLTSNYVLSIGAVVCDAGRVSIKSPDETFLVL